jgi:hypothetical protein
METEDRTVSFAQLRSRFALLEKDAEIIAIPQLNELRRLQKDPHA